MELITSILNRKVSHIHRVAPESTVTNALQQMRSENVDYLVVINDDDRFLGILTDQDVATKVIFGRKSLHATPVREIMNTRLPVATVDDTVERCMRTMRQHNVRFVLVFDGFDFKGVVSSDDIINEALENKVEIFDGEEEHFYAF